MSEQTKRPSLRRAALSGIGTAALAFGILHASDGGEPTPKHSEIPVETRLAPEVTAPPVLAPGAPTGSEDGGPITLDMITGANCNNLLSPIETSTPSAELRPLPATGTLTSDGVGSLARPSHQ